MMAGLGAGINAGSTTQAPHDNGGAIMGYTVSPELREGLARATLAPPENTHPVAHMMWFEMTSSTPNALSPASLQSIKRWEDSGINTVSHSLEGSPFWCSSEILTSPELITLTTKTLSSTVSNRFEAHH
jgi:hypothetical protein